MKAHQGAYGYPACAQYPAYPDHSEKKSYLNCRIPRRILALNSQKAMQ